MTDTDMYGAGWDAGYRRALLDVRAELDRITAPQARRQAELVVVRLLAQHRTDTGAAS